MAGVTIVYPNHFREKGVPNNTLAFNAMQKDLDIVRGIIKTYQQTGTLSEEDIQNLHANIADMSYILCNAVPFFRGTSSANLAEVIVPSLIVAVATKSSLTLTVITPSAAVAPVTYSIR